MLVEANSIAALSDFCKRQTLNTYIVQQTNLPNIIQDTVKTAIGTLK